MDETEFEKCIYKSFAKKNGPALSAPELYANFQIISGESVRNYSDLAEKVVKRLIESKYLKFENRLGGMGYYTEGLNFDEWETKMNPQASNNGFSIGTLNLQNAQNVQLGNQNKINAGISTEEFIHALTLLRNKPEEEKNSILDKVLSTVNTGVSLASAVATFSLLR